MNWILIILGIVLAAVAVFALQNPASVTIRLLNLEADAPVLVVILVSFVAGVFAGILALLPSSIRKSGRMRKMSSELRSLEKNRSREAEAEAARPRASDAAPPGGSPAPSVADASSRPEVETAVPASPSVPSEPVEAKEGRGLGRFFR